MKRMLKVLILLLSIVPSLCLGADIKPVKYVFLFIGDGMSIPQRMAAEEYSNIVNGRGLAINAMKYKALTRTRSADSFITDSAASGTAIACGTKTKNGSIGVDVSGARLQSIAEVARDSGRKVGIITCVTLNHATPAAFYAHNKSRGNYYEIALDMLDSNFDFFGGGGIQMYDNSKSKRYKGSIFDLAAEKSYKLAWGAEGLAALKPGDGKAIAVGTGKGGVPLPYRIDNSSGPRIADYAKKAIELLDNDRGFFIMVEGGKIDWTCHANDAATLMHEVMDFDNAVKVGLEFAKNHPQNTLVVVTGDHETGGLTLGFGGTGYKSYIERLAFQKKSWESFRGKFAKLVKQKGKDVSFDDVKPLIEGTFGLKFLAKKGDPMGLSKSDVELLKEAFARNVESPSGRALPVACAKILDNKAGLGWTSGAHTALPVETSAEGVNAHAFSGGIDNTDIAKILKSAVR